MSVTLLWLCAPAGISNASAQVSAAAFVQVSGATPQTKQSQVSVTYTNAQVEGDTNILAIGWKDATSTITSVIDLAGNTYQLAVPTARGTGLSQAIYYAKDIHAAAAGANTVTVTFNAAAPFIHFRALEYSGLDPANPLDVGVSANGTSATPNSGSVTTTVAQELVFGAGRTYGTFTAAGTNFTSRAIATAGGDIAEDMFVTATGSYSATATLSGSAAWVMQVAAFRNAGQSTPPTGIDVVTQHYDVQRTGWNSQETVLTASNVNSATFGLLHSVAVDDQVDAQPLVLTNQAISGVQGNRTVVYVATEGNTVYAIDASSGTVLLQQNLGTPVSESMIGNCNNNAVDMGIMSTPVIDRAAGMLFVVTFTPEGGVPTYRLHALSLTTLTDAIPPVVVTASHTLTDGTTYTFNASKNRQRAGLLEANGNIYVAFTSFCDLFANVSRGWVLGWNASTLTPLAANQLNDTLAPSPTNNYFLSSVWMSGNGLAASPTGGIFFATGNSGSGSYDSVNNLSESVVNLSSDLTKVTDFFTPSNVNTMDSGDKDLSSGGVLLIPPQTGTTTQLATALSKDGRLFLLDQGNLGKFTSGGSDKVLGTFSASSCWCAESYYQGPTGEGRVVTSGGGRVIVWRVQASPLALVKYETMPAISTGQDPGFFTSVSANGNQSGTIIIWAVSRPINASPANVLLYAFNVANSSLLYSATAGTWPNTTGNANIVPVVANGQVFVASNQQLAIFGLITPGATLASPISTVASQTKESKVSGWIDQINGTELVLRKRNGTHVTVDAKPAEDAFQSVPLGMEEAVTAIGYYDAQGVLHAQTIVRAKDSRDLWPSDRGGN